MADFKDQIKLFGGRVLKLKDRVSTEEATKTALIMPFIKELGYDTSNPAEFVPEFVSDIGNKKGEKVDYAILKDEQVILLIECKSANNELNVKNEGQLFRYFHASRAKFAILTNGVEYRFYTDLISQNVMDEKPFFSFDITQIKENQINELEKFCKSNFKLDDIMHTASDLKYASELKLLINQEIAEPSDDFIRYFARQIYSGAVTQKVIEQFKNLIKKLFAQQISDMVTDKLQSALDKESNERQKAKEIEQATEPKIMTTQDELDAFYIIRAILCAKVKLDRIVCRDAVSYFSVLFDDNNRKPICRLYLDKKKQIVIFNGEKKESKHDIQTIEDIYKYTDELLSIAEFYGKQSR